SRCTSPGTCAGTQRSSKGSGEQPAVSPRLGSTCMILHEAFRGTDFFIRNGRVRKRWASVVQHPHAAVLAGKLQGHDRADAFLALDANLAAVLAHEARPNNQPKSVAPALRR